MEDKNKESTFAINIIPDEKFDPLEDINQDEVNETDEFYGTYKNSGTSIPAVIFEDRRPAEERIKDLFDRMKLRRKILISILEFCRQKQPVDAVRILVDELQENDRSVFSAVNFCVSLEKAGALIRQDEKGCTITEETVKKPKTVIIDGVEFLEAQPQTKIFWKTTSEGLAAAEADKPLDKLMVLLEEDVFYNSIYEKILNLCAQEKGATADDLGAAIDNLSLVQEPRLFAPHFFERLERCGALTWNKTWKITSIGKQGLEALVRSSDKTNSTIKDTQ